MLNTLYQKSLQKKNQTRLTDFGFGGMKKALARASLNILFRLLVNEELV
jgi:hypothetical protein